MIASERNLYILKQINAKGVINLKEIARELGISETTVRRDFEKLERTGRLKRVQGGAALHDALENAQLAMREKKTISVGEKQHVAHRASLMVKDGDSVFLDCGTSLVPLAEILFSRPVKIVTTNTLLVNLPGSAVATVFLIGGQYHSHYNMTYGPLAKEILERFSFDHTFIGCFGVSLEQNRAFTLEVDSMQMKLAAMQNARQKHLLLDHSKLFRGGFYAFAELSLFDTVFCDSFPPEQPAPPNLRLPDFASDV
ncbi:MAG: DeoR/GlpR family DNA-binding transcription regulator [Spirochaetaceae bacterium]|jgi:DeoR/GlpR family transcriptional regulator of sugar metabolism|nr:DeoR/GlpR family DNA-binding transcription regulator [Spirochaetaceae bacterium]